MAITEEDWDEVLHYMHERFGKDADVKSVLFVLGLRETGKPKKKYTKEEKQDLMNLAFCKVLGEAGYFEVSHLDAEGWPMWKQVKPLPVMNNKEQEEFIKEHIVRYFKAEKLIKGGRRS